MELGEFFNRSVKSFVRGNLYTAMPAQVVSVADFATEQTIDVKPVVRRVYEDTTVLESPDIYSVPVMFPSAGGGLLSFPIQVGDTVLLVFSMRSIEDWLEGDGSVVTPSSSRAHSLTDAIAIPGLYTKTSHLEPNTDDVELKFRYSGGSDESRVTFKKNGDIEISSETKIYVTAPIVSINGV
jgi:hypothetical protein